MDDPENNLNTESIHSYDEDDDFPQYANRVNKKLNNIIKNYKAEIKILNREIEEDHGMVKVLDEHTKSVEQQVSNKQMVLDHTKEQIKNEQHTIQYIERQVGKLKAQKKVLDEKELTLQERLNGIQQMIYLANEKMDKHKLEMKKNQEELEQWALAARQKEDDNLSLEKYKRGDELKIKELMLQIEKLTIEVNRKSHELEKEVTETQAAQIEMEKTTEELKILQQERQDLLDKLLKTEEQIKVRHEELKVECDEYFNNKTELANLKNELDSKIDNYNNKVKLNKNATEDLKKQEAIKNKLMDELVESESNLKELYNDIEIKKNELSALARELTIKSNTVSYLKNELENKRKKLDEAKNEYGNKKDLLNKNEKQFGLAKDHESETLSRNEELEKTVKLQRQTLENKVNLLYDKSKALYQLRENEANMIGEINNILSAKKNIKGNIHKLEQEILKQQELLYNVDFQIQLMERKVAWVQGKRTKEETEELNTEIKSFENDIEKKKEQLKKLKNSLKSIDEDLHAVETNLKKAQEEKTRLTHIIEELQLENMKSSQNVGKITKKKEETLVQHDLMKLEIKKLHDRLVSEANHVFTEENKLYQLEISIKDREKEIQVHKEVLIAEHKAAEEERHKAATELTQKIQRANNLKLKYESIVQRTKKTNEDEANSGEHSQAYYVIKTAQEKEELQRQQDEMKGKITKCQKDLKSLEFTITNLKDRNEKLKNSLLVKRTGTLDKNKKAELEEKVQKESEEMWEKKNELKELKTLIEQDSFTLTEKMKQNQVLKEKIDLFSQNLEKIRKETDDTDEKLQRAMKKKKQTMDNVKRLNPNLDWDRSNIGLEIELSNEKLKNQYLMNAISILCSEIPELKSSISEPLGERGIVIPSRPNSDKLGSESSHKSSQSNFSMGGNRR